MAYIYGRYQVWGVTWWNFDLMYYHPPLIEGFNNIYKSGIWNWTLLPKSTVVKMKQPFAHFLILLVFMSCLCLGYTKKRTHKKTHVAKHNNKRWKIKTVDGREKGKGDDYQELDVNGERLFHKDTRMATRTLNFKAGNGNWWRPYNLKRKLLNGPDHTFHGIHGHIFCSFVGKHGWKTVESFPIWFVFW